MSDSYRDNPKSAKIYISNLNMSTTENDLHKHFEEFGKIVSANLRQKDTGITFAFIEYESVKEAENAVNEMNRKKVDDKELKVEFARGERNNRGGFNNRGRGDYNRDRGDRGDRYDRGDRGDRGGYQRDNSRGDFGGGSRNCYNCNKEGHFARECPEPRKPRQYDNRDRGGDRGGYRGRDNRDDNRKYERKRSNSDKSRSRSRSNDRKKTKTRKRSPSNSS